MARKRRRPRKPRAKPQLNGLQRYALTKMVSDNPELTLADLAERVCGAGLGLAVAVGDLLQLSTPDPCTARPEHASGPIYDRIVLDVITEAGVWVAARHLRPHVGGPRWKLQSSLGRLVAAGVVERKGKTSDTWYRVTLGVLRG